MNDRKRKNNTDITDLLKKEETNNNNEQLDLAESDDEFEKMITSGGYFGVFDEDALLDPEEDRDRRGGGYEEDDLVSLYLKDIGKIPLLSVDQEIALGCRIREGDSAAEKKLVEHNLRLAFSIAKRYRDCGVELMDLVQEANGGLGKAAKRFDYTRGYRFSTYATPWVLRSLIRYLAKNSRLMAIPENAFSKIREIRRFQAGYLEAHGRTPDIDAIARGMKLKRETVIALLDADKSAVNIDTPIGEDDDMTAGEKMVLESNDTWDAVTHVFLREALEKVMDAVLDPRAIKVICMCSGVGGYDQKTLREVGDELKLSPERVRQILARAEKKIRESEEGKALYDFIA